MRDVEELSKERVRMHEALVTGGAEWLPTDLSLDKLGPFCNIYLQNVVTLIKNAQNQQQNFQIIVNLAKNNLNNLIKMLGDDPKLKDIVGRSIDLLEMPQEEIATSLKEIAKPLYTLFSLKLRRAQVSLHFLSEGKARSADKTPMTAIDDYIRQTLPRCCPEDTNDPQPFVLDISGSENLKNYLTSQIENIPLCPCGQPPLYFAMPCQCPIGCENCYHPTTDMNICPECLKPITEVVQIVL